MHVLLVSHRNKYTKVTKRNSNSKLILKFMPTPKIYSDLLWLERKNNNIVLNSWKDKGKKKKGWKEINKEREKNYSIN